MIKYRYATPKQFAEGYFKPFGNPVGLGEGQYAQVQRAIVMADNAVDCIIYAVVIYDDSPGGRATLSREADALDILAALEKPL